MPNFIEIGGGGGSRKCSKQLVDLTRNDPTVASIPSHVSSMVIVKRFVPVERTYVLECPLYY